MKVTKFKAFIGTSQEIELIEIKFDDEDVTSVTIPQAKELIKKLQKALVAK